MLLFCEKVIDWNGNNTNKLSHSLTRSLTHLGKVEFELLAVELGLVQLDASARRRLRSAEVDPNSPEALEHLESRLLVVDPEQGLEPLLQKGEGGEKRRSERPACLAAPINRLSTVTFKRRESPSAERKNEHRDPVKKQFIW